MIFFVDEKSQMQALDLICQEWIRPINDYMDNHNCNPRVFVGSARVERILENVARTVGRTTLGVLGEDWERNGECTE